MLLHTIRTFTKFTQTVNVSYILKKNNWQDNITRYYAGAFRRVPAAIVNEEELFEIADDDALKEKIVRKEHRKRMKLNKRKKNEIKVNVTESVEKKKIFTKVHENATLLSSVVLNARTKSKRQKEQKLVLEGFRLMIDAIDAGLLPEIVIYNQKSLLEKLPSLTETKFYQVPYKSIQLWSNLTTSPGIMGIFPMPEIKSNPPEFAIPLTIICDNVRDPGNMGSILRAAAAVGCEQIILTKGCVDIWESKVLRSAAGAHFKMPIYLSITWEEINNLIHPDADIFAADNNSSNEEREIENKDSESKDEKDENTNDSENKIIECVENDENNDINKKVKNNNKITKRHYIELIKKEIGIVPYYIVNYTKNSCVLIIGGETEGLSENSLRFIQSRCGTRLNIPLYNKIESLNTGMAMGIIAYEISRQYNISDKNYSNENAK